MSRIRNRLRFQSPEERVLNGLLVGVLIVLAAIGLNKWRDDRAVASPTKVRGIQVSRSPSHRPDATTPSPSTSVSTATTATTTAAPDPIIAFLYTIASRPHRHSTKTTTTLPFWGYPNQPTTPTTRPTTPTTRPTPTTTTTEPTTTTTTTSPTTTTT